MRNQLKSVWVLICNYKLNLHFEIKLIEKKILKIKKFLKKTKQNVLLRLEKITHWTYYKKLKIDGLCGDFISNCSCEKSQEQILA